MNPDKSLNLNRRQLLGVAGAAALGLARPPRLTPATNSTPPSIGRNVADFVTPADQFGTVERGSPLPYTLPPERLVEVGLDRQSWQLEVVADSESDTKLERPMTKELGTALDWAGLMKLAEKSAVSYLKLITCNNIAEPLGIGLWEGVPLRDVIWLARPVENLRRVFYYGYHNDDPAQRFQSSLSIGRVLEDPPGEYPILLCYKLNGQWLTGKRGGPVRMLVPEAYGFKSVKWLQRVVLTNNFQANDTYAAGNNDIESSMKTFARFINPPKKVNPGEPITLDGRAQVGQSGLSKVQVWVAKDGIQWPEDDPYFTNAPWVDATIQPAPTQWGSELPDSELLRSARGFDPTDGRPRFWPMRYNIAEWSHPLVALEPGKYTVSCRTIDENGVAQPLPRPFPKSGRNSIQRITIEVSA